MYTPPRSLVFASLLAIVFAFFAGTSFAQSTQPIKPTSTIALFNGKDLQGWIPYAKDNHPDAAKTWSVAGGVIKDTGTPAGYLRTVQRYRDYQLTVEWRWTAPATLNDKGEPRKRNSGVLLHMQGTDTVWPKSLEAQLMEQSAGDFYGIGGVETAELVAERDKAIAAAGSDAAAKKRAMDNRRMPRKAPASEKPDGEWNTYDIICKGDTVRLRVNGVEQNYATGVTVQEGHICLQSEGAQMEFRNIKLTPLP